MYCSKCGKEVKNTDGYCPNCGAKIGSSGMGLNLSADTRDFVHQVLKKLKAAPKIYYASILLLILCAFLIGNSMFQVSYKLFTAYSYEMTMFESKESWETVFILGYAAAILVLLYPMLLEKEWKTWQFIPGIVVPGTSLIWFFAVLIKAASGTDLGAYSDFADALNFSAGLTPNAILFLLASIGAAAMTYLSRNAVMNIGNTEKAIEPNQCAKAKVVGVTMLPPDKVKDGRDVRMTFELKNGEKLHLLEKSEYQATLGDEGTLTWNGGIVVFFEKN